MYVKHVTNDAGEWTHEFDDSYRSVALRRTVDGEPPFSDLGSLAEMDTPWGRFNMMFVSCTHQRYASSYVESWTSHGPPIDP